MRAPEKGARGCTKAKQPAAYRGRLPGEGYVSGRPLTPTLIIFSGEASPQTSPSNRKAAMFATQFELGTSGLRECSPDTLLQCLWKGAYALRWGLHPDRTGMRPAQGFDCFSPCQILLLPSICVLHRTPTEALHRAEALFKNVLAQFILPLLAVIHDPF